MRLTVIGCSDAFGSGGRFNTCFMVEGGKSTVLLDCGASSPVALKVRNVDFNSIDGIVLTHLHGDHFGAIPFFMLESQFHLRRERPLTDCRAARHARSGSSRRWRCSFRVPARTPWRFPFTIGEITPGVPDEVLGFAVRTAEVIHQSGAPSTAVRLTEGGKIARLFRRHRMDRRADPDRRRRRPLHHGVLRLRSRACRATPASRR